MPLSDQFSDDRLGIKPGGQARSLPQAPATAAPATTAAPAPASDTGWSVPPLAQTIGSSVNQGLRDVMLTAAPVGQWFERNIPGVQALDERMGITPQDLQAQSQQYAASPAAQSIPGMLARYGTQMAVAAPLVGPLAEMVPAAGAAAPWLARAPSLAAKGAIMGGGTNLLASGGMGENPLMAAGTGAAGGAIVGPLAEPLGGMLAGGNQALTATAGKLGIDLSLGQRMGGLASWIEDATKLNPLAGASKFAQQQQDQIANVIRREAGMTGSGAIDTAEIATAKQAAGADIGTTAGGVNVPVTPALQQRLGQVRAFATQAGTDQREAKVYQNLYDELTARAANNNGVLSGADFQNFVQRNGPLDNALGSRDPDVAQMAQGFRDALYDTAANNGQGSQAAVDAWRNARYRYKVLATVEPQITTAGDTSSMSNAALARDIRKEFGTSPTQVPQGGSPSMQDLAQVMRGIAPLRSSGTAERLAWMAALGGGAASVPYFLQHPTAGEQWLLGPGAVALGTGLLGAGMRFAPGLTSAPAALANQLSAPAALGPWAGRQASNLLLGTNYQPAPGVPAP